MKRRSYEYYEIWRNLGQESEVRKVRGSWDEVERKWHELPDLKQDNAYLVRVQVLEVKKAEKKEHTNLE